ncbi:MAG: hypothetical protein ACLUEK_10440 [Oscillospiraceae bacterium]
MEENTVQTAAAEGGRIDVAEMMRGVTDDAEPAMNPGPKRRRGELHARHLGETKNVGRDEVIARTEGHDYDASAAVGRRQPRAGGPARAREF